MKQIIEQFQIDSYSEAVGLAGSGAGATDADVSARVTACGDGASSDDEDVVVVLECRTSATFSAAARKFTLRGATPAALLLEPQTDEHHAATEVSSPPPLPCTHRNLANEVSSESLSRKTTTETVTRHEHTSGNEVECAHRGGVAFAGVRSDVHGLGDGFLNVGRRSTGGILRVVLDFVHRGLNVRLGRIRGVVARVQHDVRHILDVLRRWRVRLGRGVLCARLLWLDLQRFLGCIGELPRYVGIGCMLPLTRHPANFTEAVAWQSALLVDIELWASSKFSNPYMERETHF